MTETFKTSKGFEFEKVEGGWRDKASGLIWFEEFKTNINQYAAENWAAAKWNRLPTKEEFEEAAKHGICFWSSTQGHKSPDLKTKIEKASALLKQALEELEG
jgi:hypothetical protein